MLEIAFDETAHCRFLGQKCQMVDLVISASADWQDYLETARKLIDDYANQAVVIVNLSVGDETMNYLALALSVETYEEQTCLESVVFKVKNSREAMNAYKPFMALANSLRYARDLLRLPQNERFADIKRLGYLGLQVKEDYIKESIEIDWPGISPTKRFAASGEKASLVLIGIIKCLAILKAKPAIKGFISKVEIDSCELISEPETEEEMVEKIIAYVRKNYDGN